MYTEEQLIDILYGSQFYDFGDYNNEDILMFLRYWKSNRKKTFNFRKWYDNGCKSSDVIFFNGKNPDYINYHQCDISLYPIIIQHDNKTLYLDINGKCESDNNYDIFFNYENKRIKSK